jgi:tetratricopeptide (TPR) repeat protein
VKAEELQQASEPLRDFFQLQGLYREGIDALAQALAGLSETRPDHHAALGSLFVGQAWLYLWLGLHEEVTKLAGKGLELLRPLKENKEVVWGLLALGFTAKSIGEQRRSRLYYQEALALAKQQRDYATTARCLTALAHFTLDGGSYSETVRYANEAIALYRQLNDQGVAILS